MSAAGRGGEELAEDVIGNVTLEFGDWDKRRKVDVILATSARAPPIPGVSGRDRRSRKAARRGKPVQLQLTSTDFRSRWNPARRHRARPCSRRDGRVWSTSRIRGPCPASNGSSTSTAPRPPSTAPTSPPSATRSSSSPTASSSATTGPDDADDEIDIVARFPQEIRNIASSTSCALPTHDGLGPGQQLRRARRAKPQLSVDPPRRRQPRHRRRGRTSPGRAARCRAGSRSGLAGDRHRHRRPTSTSPSPARRRTRRSRPTSCNRAFASRCS